MPLLQGGTDDETHEQFLEHMVENGPFEDQSAALEFCVKYTLINKYSIDV